MVNQFGVLAMAGAYLAFIGVAILALYIYFAIALMAIAKKTKTENGWLAFIPIANIYLMTKMAKVSPWLTLIVIAGIIPVIGSIVMTVLFVYLFWKIAEAIGKPGWWGILMILPIVNLVIVGIMAWGK